MFKYLSLIITALLFLYIVLHLSLDNIQVLDREIPIIKDARSYFKEKKLKRTSGQAKLDKPEMYGQIQNQLRTPIGKTTPEYSDNYLVEEYSKAKRRANQMSGRSDLDFVSRGPGNIAGRTRAILLDPRDSTHSSWIAGSASGGIWKTKDAGKTWRNVSKGLSTLSTNTLAMAPSDPDVIYAGTGEHFVSDTDGNGLWKSLDNGESWTQIASPTNYEGFKNVSRVVVNPNNSDVLLVSTSNGSWVDTVDYAIWKSIDGGDNFERVYTSEIGRIDDLDPNPENFNTIYAAVRGFGLIKSLDQGESWVELETAFGGIGRVETAVSSVDTAVVWASADGGLSDVGSTVYVSLDAGALWSPLLGGEIAVNYLGGQGFYDNIITPHPYDPDIAYVGGVNLFKITALGTNDPIAIFNVKEEGTEVFMNYINANNFADEALIPEDSINSIEIRFGEGGQMAHRFLTGGQGAGVSFGDYTYADYVEVPFTVWDTDNNVQLMVSFRDQQEDGAWDLIERNTGGSPVFHSREYIFIHDKIYSEEPSASIAVTGGTEDSLMYFIWPHLVSGESFDPETLPVSKLKVKKATSINVDVATEVVSDAYGQFNDINNFSNDNFINQMGLHPDQHNIIALKDDAEAQTFRLLVSNDGGVYVSNSSTDPGTKDGDFNYAGFGFNTSQFYGADKAPGEDRYIGGMQDNSTFFTPRSEVADSATRYQFAIGGDGFEAIWNNSNPYQMIGASQFNNFARTLDGGDTWISAEDGYDAFGPFISRIANSKRYPNRLYTVGSSGVYRSDDFGGFWTGVDLGDLWDMNNSTDIEVSHADSSVIWAGGFLSEDSRVFVSTDLGETFAPVSNYEVEEMGFVSGIGTHASEKETGYLLFSFAGKAKVLRTTDLGQSWEDISGFESNEGVSDRGFPDVAIQCLLVFPNNTDRIWVGSEIGIIESLDNGLSWNLLESNMPPANIHEFKIQDDQIVIATYGRGIWSVDVDGIDQKFILPPSIISAETKLTGEIFIDYFLSSEYDSSKILINGDVEEFIESNLQGEYSSTFSDLGLEGDIVLQIESFKNGANYLSPPFNISLFIPGEIVTQYNNEFEDLSRSDEFFGFGFRVALEEDFEDLALHSDHPYLSGTDYTYLLKSPYLLTEESSNEMQFKEVVLVETGELGAVFGDFEFWDYVIVEGSKDGLVWDAILDGYDSGADPKWTQVYDAEGQGSSDLYKSRKIDLEETFAVGDTIILRFRLNSDAFVEGWGWAIDDLEIGDVTSGIFERPISNRLSIFPNPVTEELRIHGLELQNDIDLKIYDLSGSLILRGNSNSVNVSQLTSGSYLLKIHTKGISETHKFIKF